MAPAGSVRAVDVVSGAGSDGQGRQGVGEPVTRLGGFGEVAVEVAFACPGREGEQERVVGSAVGA
jgi:hypothetical protein